MHTRKKDWFIPTDIYFTTLCTLDVVEIELHKKGKCAVVNCSFHIDSGNYKDDFIYMILTKPYKNKKNLKKAFFKACANMLSINEGTAIIFWKNAIRKVGELSGYKDINPTIRYKIHLVQDERKLYSTIKECIRL